MMNAPVRGRWLREPLLHFLIIGTGLFLLYQVTRGGDESAPREIAISESRIEALAENFARTWMRPPTPQELRGLVDDYVKEEVFYREAIAMGLDRDDTVIRRRLRQKMEFVSEDAAAAAEPTDAQLQQFLTAHPEKFVEPARVTFQQVFVNAEKRGDAARRDAERILAELQAGQRSGERRVRRATQPCCRQASRMHPRRKSPPASATSSANSWKPRRSINGPDPLPRRLACIWCGSARAVLARCRSWPTSARWSCASGRRSNDARMATSSTRRCAPSTRCATRAKSASCCSRRNGAGTAAASTP